MPWIPFEAQYHAADGGALIAQQQLDGTVKFNCVICRQDVDLEEIGGHPLCRELTDTIAARDICKIA